MDHILLDSLSRYAREGLDSLPKLLDRAMPLKGRHRKELPKNVADLSARLTTRRSELTGDYLQSPADQSAYVRYFLPWNLYRLCRLLPGLDLGLQDGDMVADIGSGPLTLPLALWLSRPDLRDKELSFVCIDRSRKIMALGRDIFHLLAKQDGEDHPGWRISLLHAPLHKGLSMLRGSPALIGAVNVLNEAGQSRKTPLEVQLEDLTTKLARNLAKPGRLLLVEPGTRLGGKLVGLARKGAVESGLYPIAPCPHPGPCPALEQNAPSWCHFTFQARDVPGWLKDLSHRSGLGKERLSLSFALLADKPASTSPHAVRIISDPFPLPGRPQPGRYGCTDRGWALALGPKGPDLASGSLVQCRWPDPPERDAKSGALIVDTCAPGRP